MAPVIRFLENRRIVFFFLCLMLPPVQAQHRAGWMQQARWGVMVHYLADWIARAEKLQMDTEAWNRLVDGFDAKGLAEQLHSAGAGYLILTIGQNSGFYLSPNETYDRIVGNSPGRCSKRDLVSDMHEALRTYGIRLIVYLPSGAPNGDANAKQALDWQNGPHPNSDFQLKWEKVIREWSLRWGERVGGWWFDGCYWPNAMYRSCEPPNFESFASAARAGNPVAAVAFNPGVVPRLISMTPHEDYTAGEISDPDRLEIRRAYDGKIDGAQIHVLSHLGERWGMGAPRFSDEQVIRWSLSVFGEGGAVTWDVPVQSTGLVSEPFLRQLCVIRKALGKEQTEMPR